MEKMPSFDEIPTITFDWKEFKNLSKKQQIACLNFTCWVAKLHWLISDWERKKINDRARKLIANTAP